MLINKIFHLRQPVPEARKCLRKFATWDELKRDSEVQCSTVEEDGIGRFEFKTGLGQRISTDIQELPGSDPNRILFRSVGGNVGLAGMIELFPIRENLTEVVLTLDYEPATSMQRVFQALDRFLNRQLAKIEECVARAREGASGFA